MPILRRRRKKKLLPNILPRPIGYGCIVPVLAGLIGMLYAVIQIFSSMF